MLLNWRRPVSRSCVTAHNATHKVSGHRRVVLHARKQAEQKEAPAITTDDAVPHVLPADLDKSKKLTKGELQRELDMRGLDQQGDKLQLAGRLLDNLIAQESALADTSATNGTAASGGAAADIPAAMTVPGRRSRRTSRKATMSVEPTADDTATSAAADVSTIPVNDQAAAAAASAPTTRRGRRTSRRATTVMSEQSEDQRSVATTAVAAAQAEDLQPKDVPQEAVVTSSTRRSRRTSQKSTATDYTPAPAATVEAGADGLDAAVADEHATKRNRRSSRKTSAVEPMQTAAAIAPTAVGATRTSRKSSMVEPVEAAGMVAATGTADTDGTPAVSSTRRARRSSRKSSVVEPAESAAGTTTADSSAQTAVRRPRNRSGARTTSKAPTAETAVASPSNSSSRVKSLAQQLAKKALASEPAAAAAAAPVAAAAAIMATREAEAVPAASGDQTTVENTDLFAYDQFYAGSQAQSDSILMEGRTSAESSYDNLTATYEEVIAQVSAERQAGLADEPQLAAQPAVDTEMAPATLIAEEAVAPAQIKDTAVEQSIIQDPSLADIAADMSEPAEASLGEDEEPDVALNAFDHMAMEATTANFAPQQQQQPSVLDISSAAAEDFLDHVEMAAPLEEDEEADIALTAFDHLVVDPTAPQPAEQHPNLADIAAAIAEEPAVAEDASLGEDGNADAALTAFDHEKFAGVADQRVALPATETSAEASSAQVVDAAEASPTAAVAGSSFVGSSSSAEGGIASIMKGWIAAVIKMFQDWQKALSQ